MENKSESVIRVETFLNEHERVTNCNSLCSIRMRDHKISDLTSSDIRHILNQRYDALELLRVLGNNLKKVIDHGK